MSVVLLSFTKVVTFLSVVLVIVIITNSGSGAPVNEVSGITSRAVSTFTPSLSIFFRVLLHPCDPQIQFP